MSERIGLGTVLREADKIELAVTLVITIGLALLALLIVRDALRPDRVSFRCPSEGRIWVHLDTGQSSDHFGYYRYCEPGQGL
jgi:hypothetical protein